MKTLQIICLFAILNIVTGCKDTVKEPAVEQKELGTLPEIANDSLVEADAAHNSKNSLDWTGTYAGKLPCGDCPGLETQLTINSDDTYSLSSMAINKDKKANIYKGAFTWDASKSVITLDAEGDHLKFKVQEGCVTMLDKFGDPKQGGGNYTLGKKQ